MEIARERFVDDSKQYHMTLGLRSRTTEMHSVLTALTPEERDAIGAAIARALDEISTVIASRLGLERQRLTHPPALTG